MLLRKTCFLLLISVFAISAQSIDEEERVHVGEGSANALSDDEDSDMEGSSLPPDTYYATTPQLRQKFPSTRMETTTTKIVTFSTTDRIVTSPRNVIEVTTSSDSRPPVPSEGTSNLFGFQGVFIVLGVILVVLVILIAVIIIFRAKSNKKQAYRPGQRESPDALLKE